MTVANDTIPESAVNKIIRRASDRFLARILRLPPAANRYRVARGVRIPMRDGAELVADRFIPDTAAAAPTVLIRSPYGRGYPFPQFYAGPLAARGFHVVLQSVRGTYDSTGEFTPAVNEAADGLDTVAWIRDQPWFTGRLATIGPSYLGMTQWALLQDPPPELAASVILAAPHDLSHSWATGSFALDDNARFSDGAAHLGDRNVFALKWDESVGAQSGSGGGYLVPSAQRDGPRGDGQLRTAVRVLAHTSGSEMIRSGTLNDSVTPWIDAESPVCSSAVGRTCS